MKKVVDLAACDRMMEAGLRKAREVGTPMVLAIVDEGGNLKELRRMDGSLLVSVQHAPKKAYTAMSVQMPTADLAKLGQPGAIFYGVDVNIPNLTLIPGGLPLKVEGVVVGGVGASGGSPEHDLAVAEAMVAAF